MRISIVFRRVPIYQEHAGRLAAAIKEEKGIEPELVHGADDVFDVRLNGDLIYSKSHTGKLPEISDLLGYMTSH
ncbi:MAG: Rdx family protein [Phycisphaerales bacterium]|nr:Rdx family protein [Phycisphaerales bacterium]